MFASLAHSINYNAIDNRPDFVSLSHQPLSARHLRQASLGHEKALIQANYIKLKLQGLNVIKGGNGRFYNIQDTEMSGHQISIRLPGENKKVILNVDNVQNLVEGVVTYTGYVEGNEYSHFTLSVSDEGVMAKIYHNEYVYIIQPLEGRPNKHSVVKLDKKLMNKDTGIDVLPSDNSNKTSNYVEKASMGSGHVKVLFYYASDVYFQSLRTSNIIAEMNAVLARSKVNSSNFISSAGIINVASAFTGQCKYSILDLMVGNYSVFNDLDQDLNIYGADIAVLIAKADVDLDCGFGSVGIMGRIGGVAVGYTQVNPFAVIMDTYALGDLTAIHEIGHVFGGVHPNAPDDEGAYAFSKGLLHLDPFIHDNSWQTIMGDYGTFQDECVFNGPNSPCERLGYFSNPKINYSGTAFGGIGGVNIPLGNNNANMKKSLNNTMPIISNWQGDPLQLPLAPNPLTSTNQACFGLSSVAWVPQPTATEYRLYKSLSSSFTNRELIYSGNNNSTTVNVNSGTWYLRAQACNAIGCSVDSNQASAYIYNDCP